VPKTIAQLATDLSDAYSTDRYHNGWSGCVRALRTRGYDDRVIEAIIRSKWTRWAGDASSKPYGRLTSTDLLKFLDKYGYTPDSKAVRELVAETFSS